MPERRVPVLIDPGVTPDADLIAATLGAATPGWERLQGLLGDPGLGLELSWRHYRDGGWLCPAIRRGKNVAWLAVWDDCATVTCYFAERHRAALAALPVPEAVRASSADLTGRLLPVVVEVRTREDADAAAEVVAARLRSR
ncbi:DUF3788 family protein [Nocardioides sp.]|uniref:DUF3788 family protein n=1 Tax=Nocardioides sp. TaxID=35761 RepID=UPI002EDAEC1D